MMPAALFALSFAVGVLDADAHKPAVGPVLELAGALPRPATLTLAEIQALPPTRATWTVEGRRRAVVGVALDRLLARQGLEPGPMGDGDGDGDGKGWRRIVVASAPDGFRAVFSVAELAPHMGATRALVAWQIDGKPLAADQGPLRLVVLGDKLPSRAVRGVNRLEVVEVAGGPLAKVADVHGMAGPFAVAGFRMGQRALAELGLATGSFDLEVRHESPAEVQWSCIADGAQAATGASPGKLNLVVKEVARPPTQTRTVFRRKSTGKTVVARLKPEFVRRFLDLPRDRLAAAGAEVARLPDEEIFSLERP
jgi:formylmethanofuran dehydrogenase subunit E